MSFLSEDQLLCSVSLLPVVKLSDTCVLPERFSNLNPSNRQNLHCTWLAFLFSCQQGSLSVWLESVWKEMFDLMELWGSSWSVFQEKGRCKLCRVLIGPVAGNRAIQTGEANSIYVINCDFSLIISGLIRECFLQLIRGIWKEVICITSNYVMRTAELV